jgi:hypothetical protein
MSFDLGGEAARQRDVDIARTTDMELPAASWDQGRGDVGDISNLIAVPRRKLFSL